jgi:dCTP deaminase
MILTSAEIENSIKNGMIVISPFSNKYLNPNSYNFHLGNVLDIYKNELLDPRIEQPTERIEIDEKGLVLEPGQLYLGHTVEIIGSDYFVPLIYGRSSIARLGLFVQITAPLGDLGYFGNWTLQLTPTLPIRIYPNMRIGQVLFISTLGQIEKYDGKYQNSVGPRKSEIYKDFCKYDID